MLNPQQLNAVQSEAQTTVVIAGPGTGKTHTLIERIRYLIGEKQIQPENILAVTFTHKAAEEMTSRIQQVANAAPPVIKTIHAWCYHLLTTELPEPPILLTEEEMRSFLNTNAEEAHNYMDFDGLITTTYELLKTNDEIRTKYQQQYQHILIDEYQDLNRAQQDLLLLLAENAVLFAIGDPNQAIYGFRGANTEGFSDLMEKRANLTTITLVENYRSCQNIVDAAYSLFPLEPKQHARRTTTGRVYSTVTATENSEALAITREIQSLVGGVTRQDHDTGRVQSYIEGTYTFGDIAILMRNRFQGTALKKALIQAGLPFKYVDHEESADDSLIQALAHIAETDVLRMPFNTSLYEYISKIFSQYEVPKDLSSMYGKEARALTTNNIEHDLRLFNELAKLMRTDPSISIAAEKVNLITVHASKGLEWPVVFVPGLEDGVFPYLRDPNDTDLAEERRLLFVAMTRAKDQLYLTRSKKRMVYGKTITTPSRFLEEIPDTFFEKLEEPEKKKPRPKSLQKKLF